MPNTLAPTVSPAPHRSSLSLARTSLLQCVILLTCVFAAAAYSLVYLAHDLDRNEELENAFYTQKAMQSLEKSLRLTLKDYAFWSDAYKHLHIKVDTDWAYARKNLGPILYKDFGFQGVFVVNDLDRTVYAVIDGKLQPTGLPDWLGQPIDALLAQARAGAETETPVTTFMNVDGSPVLVAACLLYTSPSPRDRG